MTAFREGHVDADAFRIRFLEAGEGPPLVHLHGAGGPRITPGHEILARSFRVIEFEMPGFGRSPENTRTQTMAELAATMARAAEALGLGAFNLWGTSFGGTAALWLALQAPERVLALVLEAPAAIRQEGARPVSGTAEDMARLLYAHPERIAADALPDPAAHARSQPLVRRLRGPDRDPALESRLPSLAAPALVLLGTLDRVISPDVGRIYKELLPNAHLVFVYDAAHAISTDRPEAFSEVAADFLRRHDAFVISRSPTLIHP